MPEAFGWQYGTMESCTLWQSIVAAWLILLLVVSNRREKGRRVPFSLAQYEQAQNEERRRVARELHDSTAQMLTALVLNLTTLQHLSPAGSEARVRVLSDSLALAKQCSREVRTLSYLLHPPLLEELGLISALRHYVDGLAERGDFHVHLEVPDELGRLAPETELTLYRVAQEGLINARRHSKSNSAVIRIFRDAADIVLEVSDQGRGLPPGLVARSQRISGATGVGMAGMKERAELLGGRFEIESSRRGTTIRVTLPFRRRQS